MKLFKSNFSFSIAEYYYGVKKNLSREEISIDLYRAIEYYTQPYDDQMCREFVNIV
jgi:hypothetical protein